MLQRWKERRGECAVLGEITKILNEADLIATKHRFWNFYKGAFKCVFRFQVIANIS